MYIDALTLSLSVVVLVIAVNVVISYLRFPSAFDDTENRARLQRVIRTLRLNKMLALLNISLEEYVASVPLRVINRHVLTCRACSESGVCDRCLRKGVLEKNMSFCPNHGSLLQQRKLLNMGRQSLA